MKKYSKYKDSGVKSIGIVPEHWQVERMGKYFSFSKGLPITKADLKDEGIAVISYGQIHSKYNTGLTLSEDLVRRVSPSFLTSHPQCILEKNDFVFADTSEDIAGSGNFAFNDYHDEIFAGYHDVIARPHNIEYPPYLAALFISVLWKKQVQSLVNGVKVYSINKTFLKNSRILIPPFEEQKAIFSYVIKKTAQIDRFISEATNKIEKLNELKQAQVAHLVTHGTNPDAPMKDSGIAWIGQIPEHWKKARYKDVLSIQDEKVGKRKDLTLLSLTKQGVIIRDLTEMKGKFPKDFESYKVVHPDNIILCLFDVDETPRTVGLSHNEGMITGAYDVFSIKNIDKEYFLYHYLSLDDRKAMKPLYKGLRKTIPLPRLMGEHIFIPPASEQKAIVSAINSLNNKIETLVSELTTQIDHLKELKQRIISDAVTGKIDVREVNN